MKYTLLFLLSTTMLLSSCIYTDNGYYVDEPVEPYYSQYEPVIIKRELIDSTTNLVEPRKIINSGKIYVKDSLLFVSEVNEGFHILNNKNPESPVNIAFLKVLGSSDLSIKGSNLYINNAVDLIALKPNETFTDVTVTKRVKNIFPQMLSPDGQQYYKLKDDEIIINWIKRK